MTEYYPGDVVLCKVDYGSIVASESMDFEAILPFDIVCNCGEGFLILLPRDIFIKSCFKLTEKDCDQFELPTKFKGGEVCFINREDIVKLKYRMSGCCCIKCCEPCPYASPNRFSEDGKAIYICYLCRGNRYR